MKRWKKRMKGLAYEMRREQRGTWKQDEELRGEKDEVDAEDTRKEGERNWETR